MIRCFLIFKNLHSKTSAPNYFIALTFFIMRDLMREAVFFLRIFLETALSTFLAIVLATSAASVFFTALTTLRNLTRKESISALTVLLLRARLIFWRRAFSAFFLIGITLSEIPISNLQIPI